MPLNQIKANMEIQQTICKGALSMYLGPLVTDVAPGYDHITAAIGGAIAATYGASFLCYANTCRTSSSSGPLKMLRKELLLQELLHTRADIAKGCSRCG